MLRVTVLRSVAPILGHVGSLRQGSSGRNSTDLKVIDQRCPRRGPSSPGISQSLPQLLARWGCGLLISRTPLDRIGGRRRYLPRQSSNSVRRSARALLEASNETTIQFKVPLEYIRRKCGAIAQ